MIRLHRHAALLVASDEEALAELNALQSVRPAIGPKLSPIACWVDHHRVPALREALRQAGYLPQVTVDGPSPADEGGGAGFEPGNGTRVAP